MRRLVLCILVLVTCSLAPGCASNSKTVRTETVEYPAGTSPSDGEARVVERQTTTETKSDSSSGGGGILSGTVNLVGEIIALPFRLVGGLIRLIF